MRTTASALLLSLLVCAACQGPKSEASPAGAQPSAAPTDEPSVKPGINKDFLDPALQVAKYEERFEGESREIFAQRARIAGLLDLKPGMAVADVGAGTGLFTRMFASKVGSEGTVYAVDIAKQFVEHVEKDAMAKGLQNVKGVVCTERSVELPAASVDLVFVCDTYHHFEYPKHTLASIRQRCGPAASCSSSTSRAFPARAASGSSSTCARARTW